MGMGNGVCSNLASSGEPPSSQKHFNHCKYNQSIISLLCELEETAVADKPRDAVVQMPYGVADPKKYATPHMLPCCRISSF